MPRHCQHDRIFELIFLKTPCMTLVRRDTWSVQVHFGLTPLSSRDVEDTVRGVLFLESSLNHFGFSQPRLFRVVSILAMRVVTCWSRCVAPPLASLGMRFGTTSVVHCGARLNSGRKEPVFASLLASVGRHPVATTNSTSASCYCSSSTVL